MSKLSKVALAVALIATPIVSAIAPAVASPTVLRLGGSDRYATAVLVAQRAKDEGQATSTVLVTTGENYPDAISAGAWTDKAPIVLTRRQSLPDVSLDFIQQSWVQKVVVVGGPAVVDESVLTTIRGLGKDVTRIWGRDRYETSSEVSRSTNGPSSRTSIWLAPGDSFADQLNAAAGARSANGAFLIVPAGNDVPASIQTEIDRIATSSAVVNVVDSRLSLVQTNFGRRTVRRILDDPYVASWRIHGTASDFVLASGENWPDALGGVRLVSATRGLLLTQQACSPRRIGERLGTSRNVTVLGGPAAVSEKSAGGQLCRSDGVLTVHVDPTLSGSDETKTIRNVLEKVIRKYPLERSAVAMLYASTDDSTKWISAKSKEVGCTPTDDAQLLRTVGRARACGFTMRIDVLPVVCPDGGLCKNGSTVAAHEFFHVIAYQRLDTCVCEPKIWGNKIPNWYNEGIADYVGYTFVHGSEQKTIDALIALLGPNARRSEVAVGLSDIERLWAIGFGQSWFTYLYDRSFLAAAYLISRFGEDLVLDRFFTNVVSTGNFSSGFAATFGITAEQFDRDFQAWIA